MKAEYKIVEEKDMILNMNLNYVEITRYHLYKKGKFLFWDDWEDVSQYSNGYDSIEDAQARIAYLEYIPKSKVVGHFKINK